MPNQTIGDRVKAFLARHGGNAEAAVTALLTDNRRLRQAAREAGETPYKPDAKVAELTGEVQRLEDELDRMSGLVPAQGALVLAGDDIVAFNAYKALGTPAVLKQQLDELPALRATVAETTLSTSATEAAKLLGWNVDATVAAIGDKKLTVTLVDGKNEKNEAVKVPHVRLASDDKAAPVPLTDWVKSNAAYLMPALTAQASTDSTTTTTPSTGTPVTPFPGQSASGGSAAPSDDVAAFITASQSSRDARPNPFFPRKAAATP